MEFISWKKIPIVSLKPGLKPTSHHSPALVCESRCEFRVKKKKRTAVRRILLRSAEETIRNEQVSVGGKKQTADDVRRGEGKDFALQVGIYKIAGRAEIRVSTDYVLGLSVICGRAMMRVSLPAWFTRNEIVLTFLLHLHIAHHL